MDSRLPLFLAASILSAAFLCTAGCSDSSGNTTPESNPDIVILCAYGTELKYLLAALDESGTAELCGRTCHIGMLGGKKVVIASSGISEVNAAMMAQAAIMQFEPRAIIFSGVAGGINPDLNVSDVIIPSEWAQYQEQVFARPIPEGWDPSAANEIINFKNYEMMFPLGLMIATPDDEPDDEEYVFWFPVDDGMYQSAVTSLESIDLKRCNGKGECLSHQPKVVIGGKALTGTTFIDNEPYRTYLWETFSAQSVDRESAAVAHVARVNGIPFIAIRALSDRAGTNLEASEFVKFADLAAENVTTVLVDFLSVIP
jgi:adenosylhomocysteine nucleosidase